MRYSQDYLFFVRLFFILNFNYFFLFKQVWTQKCAVQKSSVNVNISYYYFCLKSGPVFLFQILITYL